MAARAVVPILLGSILVGAMASPAPLPQSGECPELEYSVMSGCEDVADSQDLWEWLEQYYDEDHHENCYRAYRGLRDALLYSDRVYTFEIGSLTGAHLTEEHTEDPEWINSIGILDSLDGNA